MAPAFARLSFPQQLTYALDPCAGTGAALQATTSNSGAELYLVRRNAGVEEDNFITGCRHLCRVPNNSGRK
jgi:hypothetical protein